MGADKPSMMLGLGEASLDLGLWMARIWICFRLQRGYVFISEKCTLKTRNMTYLSRIMTAHQARLLSSISVHVC